MTPGENNTSFRSQIGPILLLASVFFLNFIGRIGILGDAGHFAAGLAGTGVLILSGSFLSRLLKFRQQ